MKLILCNATKIMMMTIGKSVAIRRFMKIQRSTWKSCSHTRNIKWDMKLIKLIVTWQNFISIVPRSPFTFRKWSNLFGTVGCDQHPRGRNSWVGTKNNSSEFCWPDKNYGSVDAGFAQQWTSPKLLSNNRWHLKRLSYIQGSSFKIFFCTEMKI